MEQKCYLIKNDECFPMELKEFMFEHYLHGYIVDHKKLLMLPNDLNDPDIIGVEASKKNHRYDLLVKYESQQTTAIVEIKKEKIDVSAYNQLVDYIKNYANNSQSDEKIIDDNIIGVLVGTSIEDSVKVAIETSTPNIIYAIVLNRFDYNEYQNITAQVYSPKSYSRNMQKYILINLQKQRTHEIGKGRVVYEAIKSYVENNPLITSEQLNDKFPSDLLKYRKLRFGVVKLASDVSDDDKGRYFKEPIKCSDGEVLVCNQWEKDNIDDIFKLIGELGMEITEPH